MGLQDLPTSVNMAWFGDLSSSFYGPLQSSSHNKTSGFPRASDPHGQTKTEAMFFF